MMTHDSRQWMWADEFGVTRVELGQKLKIKTTNKVSGLQEGLCLSPDGSTALLVGRVQTGVYGHSQRTLLNLPGLGIQKALSASWALQGLMADTDGTPKVVRLSGRQLEIAPLEEGDARTIMLADAPRKLSASVGPTMAGQTTLRSALAVGPSGAFAALVDGVVWSGDARTGALRWSLALTAHPTVDVALTLAGDAVWVAVMDHAAGRARLLQLHADGTLQTLEVPALSLPAISADWLLYQPTGDTVIRRALADGSEQQWDIRAHNVHPFAAPEAESWHGERPPLPAALPGQLALAGDLALLIPWHAEQVVELVSGTSLDRKLPPGAGPFRRMMREIVATQNAHLAQLQVRFGLAYFDTIPKRQSCPMGVWLPPMPRTFTHQIAAAYASDLTDRYPLRAHGWSWGGWSGHGHLPSQESASEAEVRAILRWMRGAGLRPLEFDGTVGDHYKNRMGLPFQERLSDPPLLSPAAERLWLRACLETIQGWPTGDLPAAWSTEPIPSASAKAALDALPRWTGPRFYDSVETLSLLLAHHLGPDAAPLLLHLILAVPETYNWKQVRDAGESLVWLAHRHPELTQVALDAITPATRHEDNWPHEKGLLLDALKRRARNLSSSG